MSVQTRLMNYSIHSGFLCLFSGSVFVPASVFFIFLRLSSSFVFIPGYVFFYVYVFLDDKDVGVLAESLHLVIDQWIQYKLGEQYL